MMMRKTLVYILLKILVFQFFLFNHSKNILFKQKLDLGRIPHSNPFANNLTHEQAEIQRFEKYYLIISFFFYFFGGLELLTFVKFFCFDIFQNLGNKFKNKLKT